MMYPQIRTGWTKENIPIRAKSQRLEIEERDLCADRKLKGNGEDLVEEKRMTIELGVYLRCSRVSQYLKHSMFEIATLINHCKGGWRWGEGRKE